MKNFTKLTLALTLLWLAILSYFSFYLNASDNTLQMIYIIGQGFLVALVVTKWKPCKKEVPTN
jgi:hypothetical protein